MSRHLTRRGDGDRCFGVCGSAAVPSRPDPGKSRSDSEQVCTDFMMYTLNITAHKIHPTVQRVIHDDLGGDHLLSTVIVIPVMSTRCHSLAAKPQTQNRDEVCAVVSWQMLKQSG